MRVAPDTDTAARDRLDSTQMLEQFQAIVTGNVILSYALYAIRSEDTSPWMVVTNPYVMYGIFRYV